MPVRFLEIEPRDFNPVAVAGLTKEAREGVNAALKALATWRNELVDTNATNGKRVVEQMAAAAKSLGWPEQVVEATRTQLESIAEMQVKTMDHMIDAWEEQIKLPNPMSASPSAMLSKLSSLPGLASSPAASNPLEMWMQFAERWQRAWGETMDVWGKRH